MFFFKKKFSPSKAIVHLGDPGPVSTAWAAAFSQLADNFAHPMLQFGFSKTCHLAKRFYCLLISMEQWRAEGSETGLT